MGEHPTILVIGGGITGLAAAWELSGGASGAPVADVTVAEASDRFGGKLRTETADGFLVEHGPDAFVAYRPAALDLIAELGLSGEVITISGERNVWLRARGRLHPLPEAMGMVLPTRIGPFATTGILSWRDKVRAALDLVIPRILPDGDVAIGTFLRRRLGSGIVRRFADPLVGGIYGASVDELSLDAVLPSLRQNEREHRSLLLASLAQGRAARKGGANRGPSSPFRTLRGGLGSLTDTLAARLRERGVDLRTSAGVTEVTEEDGAVRVWFVDGSTASVDGVLLAGGVESSAHLLAGSHPEAAAALRAIPLATSTIVTLGFDAATFGAVPTSHGWLEGDRAPISGVTISSAKWVGRAGADRVLIRAFVPERVGPLAKEPDEVLFPTVLAHVREVLGIHADPLFVRVTRWPAMMPTYTVGHPERVRAVSDELADSRCQVAGSALRGVGIPDCISDGRRSARLLLDSLERKTA